MEHAHHCITCTDPITVYSFGACEHRDVCAVCSLRLRALYKDTRCPLCKVDLPAVVISSNGSKAFSDYSVNPASVDPFYKAHFEDREYHKQIKHMNEPRCPLCENHTSFPNVRALKGHMQSQHGVHYCDTCLEFKKVFMSEQKLYAKKELEAHVKGSDDPKSRDASGAPGLRGHPPCQFCRKHFYGTDELYTHMKENHFTCHICDRENVKWQYYKNYNDVEHHFREAHFLCEEPECLAQKFVVFSNEIDLKAHDVEVHKRKGRAAALPVAFTVRRANRHGEGYDQGPDDPGFGRRRGRGRGGASHEAETGESSAGPSGNGLLGSHPNSRSATDLASAAASSSSPARPAPQPAPGPSSAPAGRGAGRPGATVATPPRAQAPSPNPVTAPVQAPAPSPATPPSAQAPPAAATAAPAPAPPAAAVPAAPAGPSKTQLKKEKRAAAAAASAVAKPPPGFGPAASAPAAAAAPTAAAAAAAPPPGLSSAPQPGPSSAPPPAPRPPPPPPAGDLRPPPPESVEAALAALQRAAEVPRDADESQRRNRLLIRSLRLLLGDDEAKFAEFKEDSADFRRSRTTAEQYYEQFAGLFGRPAAPARPGASPDDLNAIEHVFLELAALLPDADKREALLRAHAIAVAAQAQRAAADAARAEAQRAADVAARGAADAAARDRARPAPAAPPPPPPGLEPRPAAAGAGREEAVPAGAAAKKKKKKKGTVVAVNGRAVAPPAAPRGAWGAPAGTGQSLAQRIQGGGDGMVTCPICRLKLVPADVEGHEIKHLAWAKEEASPPPRPSASPAPPAPPPSSSPVPFAAPAAPAPRVASPFNAADFPSLSGGPAGPARPAANRPGPFQRAVALTEDHFPRLGR